MESVIRLFKAVPVKTEKKKACKKALLKETLKRGFVFAPEVIASYSDRELNELVEKVEKEVGLTPEKANASFHKSWKKVATADIEQLIIEQMIHYFTTYGYEALGIEGETYIPSEKLEIPDLKDNIKLVVIKGYTKEQLKQKLLDLLNVGIALNDKTIDDVVDVALFVGLSDEEIERIKNKEIQCILYEYLDVMPNNPVEFLRYLVYRATEKTLLIKSTEVIEEIRSKKNINLIKLFEKYDLNKLSQIFYRFKPLFLAFRTNRALKKTINHIRRLAVKNHRPMPEDYLNTVTSARLNMTKLKNELEKVNIFRKIRLAYALQFRNTNPKSILYRVRNGKGFATEFNSTKDYSKALKIVVKSITDSLKVKGKKVYIPDHIEYALPSTEKQFTDGFPAGTYIKIPRDMVVGINWGQEGSRVDLDLSLISKGNKFGWDEDYRDEGRNILFSGDMTDALEPDGATELFYVKRQSKQALMLCVNYYNLGDEEGDVPIKLFIAKEAVSNMKMNYMVNPNNIVAVAKTEITKKEKILGLLITNEDESRFYFAESYVGNSITSSSISEFAQHSKQYLFDYYENAISLRDILKKSGVKFVKQDKAEIDLSPEMLEKDTIINLLNK